MTFKTRLVTTILAIFVPVLIGLALLNYWQIVLLYDSAREQVEQDVRNIIEVTNEAYHIVENSLEEEMTHALDQMREEFLEVDGVPGEMDLPSLQQRFDNRFDFYLVSPDGVIEYTTYEVDRGLDLSNYDGGRALLEQVRQRDGAFLPGMTRETRTGRLRKFGYLTAPDSDWILEVGATPSTIESSLAALDPVRLSDRLVDVSPIVEDARVLDRDGWIVSARNPQEPSDELRERARKVTEEREALELQRGTTVVRYLYVGPDVPAFADEYAYGVITAVIELTYSSSQIITGSAMITAILVAVLVLTVLLSVRAASRISRPISLLEKEFSRAARGDLTAYAQIDSDDELGTAARSFNIMMERIRELTYYDPVTGLPNRGVLREYFDAQILGSGQADGSTTQEPIAMIAMVAADRFREMNQRFGYQTGNLLLKAAADRIREQSGLNANIYRGQSDEFLLLFTDVSRQKPVANRLKRLTTSLQEPYSVAGRNISLSFTVGVAEFPMHGSNLDELIRNAAFARNLSDANEPAEIHMFDPAQHSRFIEFRELEERISTAITGNEFYFEYQPIFDLQVSRMVTAEALIRWNLSDRGPVAPDEFIPVCERSSLIVRLGELALRSACEVSRQWAQKSDIRIAVNVAARHFESPSFVDDVRKILKDTGADARHVELELTERTVLTDVETSIERLNQLRELGVTISIDDFGKGYSSLSYMVQLPVDTVKIDGSFTGMIEESNQARAVVSSVVAMCNALGVSLVAEGVETKAQLDFVRRAGCQRAQGFGMAKPVTFSAISYPDSVHPAI